jgi:hypothetical protein
MSLDISLYSTINTAHECPECGDKHKCKRRIEMFTWNITHNLGEMADKAGVYEVLWRPEEVFAKRASQLITPLRNGLTELKNNPDYYKGFNPSNGWGNYEGLVECVEKYLEACQKYPETEVFVSR